MADTANGINVNVASSLGYIETNTQAKATGVSVTGLATLAVDRANAVWDSYLDDRAVAVRSTRARQAAYYYGLESYAEELIRLRIGNIGSAKESQVAEAVLQKAMALLESAAAGIKAYEEYCANEAKVTGAKVFRLITGVTVATVTGVQAANAHWGMVSVDAGTTYQGDGKYLTGIAHAYSMQIMGAIIVQNQLTASGARNPAIGQYYLGAGQALIKTGTDLVQKFGQWVQPAKPQHTVMNYGI